jgi:hypothetical protein
MDETNRKITQMGTTYSKLQKSIEKNSDAYDKNNVSTRALTAEFAKNSEQGVRTFGGALADLTQEMIATGQNTALQRKMNADQVLQTGNNTKAVQAINKTNKDVSDKYGISNDRLIESLNSLKGVMDQASFFGPEAVTSFKNIATELKGMAGGANIEGGLGALFKVLTPGSEGIAASHLLGADGLRQRQVAGGSIDTEDLAPIFANLERLIGSSKGQFGAEIAGAKTGLGKDPMIQLMQLKNIMKSHFELSKEDQATEREKFNNIKNLQDKQNDWYDKGAVQMLSLLGTMKTSLLVMAMNLPLVGGMGATGVGIVKGPRPTGGPRPVRLPNSAMGMGAAALGVGGAIAGGSGARSPLPGGKTKGSRGVPQQTAPLEAPKKPRPFSALRGDHEGEWRAEQAKYLRSTRKFNREQRANTRSAAWQESGGADRDLRNKRLRQLGHDPLPLGTPNQQRLAERRSTRPKSRMGQMKTGLKGALGRGGSPLGGMGVGLAAGAMGQATGVDMTYTANLAMLGSVIPGIGTGIGALVGLTVDLAKYAYTSSEADKERVALEKEKADKKRAEEHSKDIKRITFLTDYLRSRAGPSLMEDDEAKLSLRAIAGSLGRMEGQPRNNTAFK